MAELDIGKSVYDFLYRVLSHPSEFGELRVLHPTIRVGYSWLGKYVTMCDEARAEVLDMLADGQYVSAATMRRVNRKYTRRSMTSRRTRVGQGLRELSITGTKDSMASALVVAAQTALDVVDTADDAIAGKSNGEGRMSESDAAAYVTEQLQSFAERCTVTPGVRAKVRIYPKAKKADIELRALRKDHPLRVSLSVRWGDQ